MTKSGHDNRAIGVFDSGVGGLTVMRQLIDVMPNESIIYYADNLNSPYGDKSKEQVVQCVLDAALFLYKKNIKVLVIACNTACIYAYEKIKAILDIPVIEIITPSFETFSPYLDGRSAAIMATKATISSKIYSQLLFNKFPSANIYSVATPLIVPFIEKGELNMLEGCSLIKGYLDFLLKKDVSVLFLACTHYPIIKNIIRAVVGKQIEIIDPSVSIAKHVFDILKDCICLNENEQMPTYQIFNSGDKKSLEEIIKCYFLGMNIDKIKKNSYFFEKNKLL